MSLNAVRKTIGGAALLVGGLVVSPLAHTDASGPLSPFPLTGAYSAFHKEDRNHISIIEISGNYNKELAPGQPNVEPRAVIAREFFRTHPDRYDFIVAFSSFEFDTGEALAFHWPVQNKVKGIGVPEFDVSNLFGSQGKLQGFTDMAALTRYKTDPLDPEFETVLSVMAHEILHQWASHVRFRLPDGSVSEGLLGRDNSHWSYLLDTDASVEYGAQWKDNGDGTFTAVGTRKFFSPLDLYLMGFYRKEEVPPFFLIENPAIDKRQFPQENVTITGTRREVTIDDIVAVEGERIPSADEAQKDFRLAFVLLVGPNQTPTDAQMLAMNNIRNAFMTRFAIMTGGRAVAQAFPEALPTVQQGAPTTVVVGDLRPGDALIDDALVWLRGRQTTQGFWMDKSTTRVRDTTSVLRTLVQTDTGFGGAGQAVQWLASQPVANTDYLARHATTLSDIGSNAASQRAQLAALQNSDGGWGLAAGYGSNPFDTALALLALAGFGDVPQAAIDKAAQYLLSKQGADGGWSSVDGGASRTSVTATVLQALKAAGKASATVTSSAVAWIATKQNADGGFGDSPSTAHDTANVLQTLMTVDALNGVRASDASGYLVSRQTLDGSWEGSSYSTALAVSVLKRFNFPNAIVVAPIVATPAQPRDGDRVALSVTVRNDGNVPMPASVLRIYDGDPAAGGTAVGADVAIPVIAPQGAFTFSPLWDTFDKAGAHTLFAVVDPANVHTETSKRDNRASLAIVVQPAADQADLALATTDIAITPAQPNALPTTLGISATVRNSGKTDAPNVRVVLWEGAIGSGVMIGDTVVSVPGRSTAVANFTYVLRKSGSTTFNVQADPDGVIAEANETNNAADAVVTTAPAIDLEITNADVVLDKNPAYLGNDVNFKVTLRNRGTLESPSVAVRYSITDGNTTTELRTNTVQIKEGATVEQNIAWRVDRVGTLTFTAQLDSAGLVPEIDEGNNAGSAIFSATAAVGPNLAVSYQDFTFNPNPAHEGYDATLSAVVRNTGNVDATNVVVAFYNGDPTIGGVQVGTTQTIPLLAAGASVTATTIWPQVPASGAKVMFVSADPQNTIAEGIEDDNLAFNLLDVLSLPDLAITAGDIQLSPSFPKTGDTVSLTARVTNLGQQGASNIVVRAFDGDPAAGGVQIGGDEVLPSIAGFGAGVVSFNWNLGATAGSRPVVVQVDPASAIVERNRVNNSARKDTAVQDGNLFATNVYFSPDGDGVKDNTQFFFRLATPTTASVVVLNKQDKVVRTYSGALFTNITDGNATWDGLDDLGRLVSDGDYRMRVLDAGGSMQGEVFVHLDTNRSSLLQAAGTKYESFNNLTCELPNIRERKITQDDETIAFVIDTGTSAQSPYPKGVYRMAGNGTEIRAIVPESWFGSGRYPSQLAFAANGSAVAFLASQSVYPYRRALWVVDGDGKNLREIIPPFDRPLNFFFSPDGKNLFVSFADDNQVRLIPLNGAPQRIVYSSRPNSIDPFRLKLSADGNKLALVDFNLDGNYQGAVVVVDVRTGAHAEVSARATNLYDMHFSWSRDGNRIATLDPNAWEILVSDRNGNLIRRIEPPLMPTPDQGSELRNLQWAANGAELAFTARVYGSNGGGDFGFGIARVAVVPGAGGGGTPTDPGGVYVADLVTGKVEKAAPFRAEGFGCFECFSYHVSTWDGKQWVERGVLHYGMHYQEKRLDLSRFLPDGNGDYRVRIRQQGLEAAHVEQVTLVANGARVLPSSALHLGNNRDVLAKVLYPDHEVLDLFGAEMEVRWPGMAGGKIELALNAREEELSKRKTLPFSYPAGTTHTYTYAIRGNRPMTVDGNQTAQDGLGDPLFKVFSRPGTGHPPAEVYGYVQSDSQYLYGALDFTVDNTEDGDNDWGAMRVRVGNAWKEFRITASDRRYGAVGFVHTGMVHHTHKYYEFKIPLTEIGFGEGDTVDVAFQAYGTAAIVIDEPSTGLSPYGQLLWAPGERSLVYTGSSYWDSTVGIFLDKGNAVRALFENWNSNLSNPEFSPTGRQLLFSSGKAVLDPTSTCYQQGWSDNWSFKTLLNLTADLRAIRSAKVGGILLKGTASDLNFAGYALDYADAASPNSWNPIAPASGQPIVDDLFTTWVPPGPGTYFVRLSVEDLAGNKRQTIKRVSWSDAPSITDLYRTPAFISPNGDGVQDAATIHYRVLEPVHLEFNFYNKLGDRVRTIARDHSVIGAEIDLIWDGRDDRGLPVADGEYRMTVQNYEFFITVDATPPALTIALGDAYRPLRIEVAPNVFQDIVSFYQPPLGDPPFITGILKWSVLDTNYRDSIVEKRAGDGVNAWQLLYDRDPRERGIGELKTRELSPADFTGSTFRAHGSDLAGNEASAQTPLAKQELVVHHFGNFGFNPRKREAIGASYFEGPTRENLRTAVLSMLKAPSTKNEGGYFKPINTIPYVPLLSETVDVLPLQIEHGKAWFQVGETMRGGIVQLFVEFRLPTDTMWRNGQLVDFLSYSREMIQLPGGSVEPVYMPDLSNAIAPYDFAATWDMNGVEAGKTYIVRLRAIDTEGAAHYSNAFRFHTQAVVFHGLGSESPESDLQYLVPAMKRNPPAPEDYVLWGQEFIGEPIAEVRLFVSSTEDPRYATPRQVDNVFAYPDGGFTFNTRELESCKTYFGTLELRSDATIDPVTGERAYRTYSTTGKPFSIPCLKLGTTIEPVPADGCDMPSKNLIEIRLTPMALDGAELKLLTLSRTLPDVGEDVLFNVNQPKTNEPPPLVPRYVYLYGLDTSGLAEGDYQFPARLINVNDQEIVSPVSVRVDHTPADVALTYPQEGQRLCGVPVTWPDGSVHNLLPIEGTITDAGGFHYQLEVGQGANPTAFSQFHDSRLLDSKQVALGQQSTAAFGNYHLNRRAGHLGSLVDLNGEITLSLRAPDWGGYERCAKTTFYFDGKVERLPATIDRKLISPNGDTLFDDVTIKYGVEEAVTLDAEVYRATRDPSTGVISIVGGPVRSLARNRSILPGEESVSWDGRDDAGATVADGQYAIQLNYKDACGNRAKQQFDVEVDNTPPAIAILYPKATDPLPLMVEIQGTVTDAHIAGYRTDYGVGSFADAWVPLKAGQGNVAVPAVLAVWNTYGFEGPHAIRVIASDTVGNQREVAVPLNLAVRANIISYLEVTPDLFSPNGDAKRETAAVRIGLDQNALVTVAILDAGGTPVRSLADAQTAAKGSLSINWDGRNDAGTVLPDGTYTVGLVAALASNPLVRQEEKVSVILDATAPAIDITRPLAGFVPAVGGMIGSIQDLHLGEYTAAITSTPAAPIWETLDSGNTNRLNSVLGSLQDRPEGEYALKIDAKDQGEIVSAKIVPFIIDSTPPKASITAPAAGSIVGIKKSPVNIAGTLEEKYLKIYKLNVGNGDAPTVWTELAAGTALPLPSVVKAWDVGALADGPYTLQLHGEDKAGLTGESRVAVIVDNTPPTAIITIPAEGSYVKEALAITGSANDAHFVDYRLDLAPGAKGTSTRWSEIGTNAQAVTEGNLLSWEALPPDGVYTLKLTAKDAADNAAHTQVQVTVDTHPPGPPQGLKAVVENGQDGHLTWTANTEPDLAGYAVYRDGIRITPALLAVPAYIDPALIEGRYTYTVTAFDHAGWESAKSEPATIVVDVTPPAVSFAVPSDGSTVSGLLDVKGTAYSADDFKEYRLYVGDGVAPTGWQLLRRSPVPVLADVLSQWNTVVLAEGAPFTLKLEAEDINGNVGIAFTHVTIDNLPPAAPTGLVATPSGANVQLTWNANTEPDLLGYLVFRDERIANAQGVVVGSLQPYAVVTTSYPDLSLPDGPYTYTIIAIDKAGNISPPSLPASVTIDTRPPHAVIVQPLDGFAFDQSLYVLATTVDSDVAHVQFQYKAPTDTVWSNVGTADTAAPYEANWAPTGLPYGTYELRAVATDLGNRVDSAPTSVNVIYKDLTKPAVVVGLSNQVNGGQVILAWTANSETDLAGYHIDRVTTNGSRVRLTAIPHAATTYADMGLNDATYRYTVIAIDTSDNAAAESAPSEAVVYTPTLKQPYTPTKQSVLGVQGKGVRQATVSGEIANVQGTAPLVAVESDSSGAFAMANIPVVAGSNTLTVRMTDAQGNISKDASVAVLVAAAPSQPTGVVAAANALNVDLTWNANPEANIIGYRVSRGAQPAASDAVQTGLSPSASSVWSSPYNAVDGLSWTYWAPYSHPGNPAAGQWLAVSWPEPRVVTQIDVSWYDNFYLAIDYDVEAWSGNAWITVAEVRGNAAAQNEIKLAQPYRTTQARVVIRKIKAAEADYQAVRLSELRVLYADYVAATNYTDPTTDGQYEYTVTALNQYGFESIPSAPARVAVGDVTAPDAVTLSAAVAVADVTLTWSASASPDVTHYDLYRDGALLASHSDLANLAYVDRGVRNGSYVYTVKALDAAGNTSVASNEAMAVVAVAPPPAPISLAITVPAIGGALDLAWNPAAGSTPPGYRVLRASTAGGPYAPVADVANASLRDSGLANGVRYFYVVLALDSFGNTSIASNEASGVPIDTVAPVVSLHYPALPGRLFVTDKAVTAVIGMTEPGAAVTLFQNGQALDAVTALPAAELRTAPFSTDYDTTPLSPDGRLAAFINSNNELAIYDFAAQTQSTVSALNDSNQHFSWSADGKQLIFVDRDSRTFNYLVRAYRLSDGTTSNVIDANADHIRTAVLSPNGSTLAVVGRRFSESGLWRVDVATNAWVLLLADDVWSFDAGSLAWSSDSNQIAYRRSGQAPAIETINASSGTVNVVESNSGDSNPRWSPDGSALLYTAMRAGIEQVWHYNTTTQTARALTRDDIWSYEPVWTQDGRAFVYSNDNNELRLQSLAGDDARVIASGDPNSGYVYGLQSVRSGYLAAWLDNKLVRIAPPGRFEYPATMLEVGDNIFSATARDVSGNISEQSPAMIVNYRVQDRADLVLTDKDIRILPAAPALGEAARISITVRNLGAAAAPASEMSLLVVDPAGRTTTLISGFAVNPLSPNASQSVSADWRVEAGEGAYHIVAIADVSNALAEVSEANNLGLRTLAVAGSSLPQVRAATDKSRYEANDEVVASATITNNGESFAGRIELAIEDSGGYLVRKILSKPISLAYATNITEAAHWNAGNTFAGNYQLRASLYDNANALVGEAVAPFAIGAVAALNANVNTDRALYTANDNVHAVGTISYVNGNSLLTAVEARLRISNPGGAVVREASVALGDLLPDAVGELTLDWNTGVATPGEYAVTVSAEQNSVVLATATTRFTVAIGTTQLAGNLDLSDTAPAAGNPVAIAYTVENKGNAALTQLPILLRVLDATTQAVLFDQRVLRDVGLAASAQGTATFSTVGLPLKTYTVVLQAEQSEGNAVNIVTLKTGSFDVVDRTPPQVDLRQPLNNGFLRGDATATVFALDSLSRVRVTEISLDGGAWMQAPVNNAAASLYGSLLPGLVEGPHTIHARAVDAWGNIGQSTTFNFIVDNTPPQIAITGVTNGGMYNTDRVPVITIEEPYLDRAFTTLNGMPYISGTPVTAEGSYYLVAQATDKAGNATRHDTAFDIDKTAPVIVVTGVDNGGAYNRDVTPVISATDAHLKSVSATLDSVAFSSGTVIATEGVHELVLTADDAAGNIAIDTISFVIDKTGPTVVFTYPADGATLATRNSEVRGRTEPNATVFFSAGTYQTQVLADGAGTFTVAQVALNEGPNVLSAYARDRADNVGPASSITVHVGATAELEAQLLPPSSVLVWIPRAGGSHCHEHDDKHDDAHSRTSTKDGDDDDHDRECQSHADSSKDSVANTDYTSLLQLVDAALKLERAYYTIVHDEQAFVHAMRSGRYRTFVLAELHPGQTASHCEDGEDSESSGAKSASKKVEDCEDDDNSTGPALLKIADDTHLAIRAHVAAGTGLVLIKNHPDNNEHWLEVAGAKPKGVNTKLEQVVLVETPASRAGTWLTGGYGLRLKVTGGTAVGKLLPDGNYPGLVINTYESGRVAWLPFNPASFKDVDGAKGVIADAVRFARPVSVSTTAGSVVELRWTASKLQPTFEARFDERLSMGGIMLYAWDGDVVGATEGTWTTRIASKRSDFRALVRLPLSVGTYSSHARLSRMEGTIAMLLREKDFEFSVSRDQTELGNDAMNTLMHLSVGSRDRNKLQKAIEFLQLALIAPQSSRAELERIIGHLLDAIEAVDAMSGSSPAVIAKIGLLLQMYELAWSGSP